MCLREARRRQWNPTPVLLLGKSHGWRSLVGCSPRGCEESDTTERLHFPFSLSWIGEGNGNPLCCSCLENPRDGGAWWAAVYGVAQSQTRLKWLSSSSRGKQTVWLMCMCCLGKKGKSKLYYYHYSVQLVQLLSHVRLSATPWIAVCQASLSITNSRSLLKLMSVQSVMPSNHLILCHPLLLLPPIPPSIRVFSNVSALRMRWPKYWSFSFSVSPSNEHPGLISFRMDWMDLLAVQGTLKSLLQHHSSKASILWCSAFFTVQLSHPYIIIITNI